MSDIVGQYATVRAAFAQPTLTLLNRQKAPATVALFRSCFSRETTTVETSRMHQLVDNLLIDLRNGNASGVPDGSGRDLCQAWVRESWLVRMHDLDGGEVYTMTSHAQTALSLVDSLEHDRPTLSEHRIATIVNAVRRFNAAANPSRSARVQILNDQITELVTERDRLEEGGELAPVTADYLLEGFVDLLSLVSALPSDFRRVTERFDQIRRQILDQFRNEEHAAGTVIDTYLQHAEELTTATPEGRAFEGAFALLRNDALLHQLKSDLDALVGHPRADQILTDADKRELRSTVLVVRRGLDEVLSYRARATKAIKDYIATHDVARDRQLDQTLRQLDQEFGPWMERTNTRTKVPLQLLPETLDIDYLPRAFHDPDQSAPPAPLPASADQDDESTSQASLAEMIAWGGPDLAALAAALARAASTDDGPQTVGELFTALPLAQRRPVDVLGLLHLTDSATDPRDRVDEGAAPEAEEFATVRPDGTTRVFMTARTALARTHVQEEQ